MTPHPLFKNKTGFQLFFGKVVDNAAGSLSPARRKIGSLGFWVGSAIYCPPWQYLKTSKILMGRFMLMILWIFLSAGCGGDTSGLPLEETQTSTPPAPQVLPHPTPLPITARFRFPFEPLGATPAVHIPNAWPQPEKPLAPPLYDVPWALGPFDHFYFARPIAADEVNWPLADYRYGGIFFSSISSIPEWISTPRATRLSWLPVPGGSFGPDMVYIMAITIRRIPTGWLSPSATILDGMANGFIPSTVTSIISMWLPVRTLKLASRSAR